jgi:tetratricopeptide (TPR) repeat protein
MKFSFLLFILLFAQLAYAQDFKKADSLRQIVEKHPLDTLGINALCDLVYEYAPVDFDKAYSFAHQALAIAQKLKDRKNEAHALNNVAIAYDFQSKFDKALEYYLKALKINEEINNSSGIAAGYMNIGVSFYFQNDLEKAQMWYLKALAIREKMNSPTETARIYNNLGITYRKQKNYEKAIEMYDKSLKIKQKQNDKKGIATTLGNIGIVYQHKGDLVKALAYQTQSLEMEQEIQHPYGIAASYIAIGEIFLFQKNYPKAQQQYQKALQVAEKAGTKELVQNAYHGLFQTDSLQGNIPQALKNYQHYVRIKDEIYNTSKSQQMIQMQTLYETQKKEHQIMLQTQENNRLKWTNIIIFTLAVLLVCLIILLYNRAKLRAKQQKLLLEKETTEKLYAQEQNQNLQKTIDFNNRELSSATLHLEQKNKVLREIREKMEGISILENAEQLVRQRLKEMVKIIWSNLSSENDWEKFKAYFEGVHPQFFTKLLARFPDLNPKEVRFCAYLKMNLDTKEMANLLNISVRSVESHRLRIRKKLLLENNENLTNYLQQI